MSTQQNIIITSNSNTIEFDYQNGKVVALTKPVSVECDGRENWQIPYPAAAGGGDRIGVESKVMLRDSTGREFTLYPSDVDGTSPVGAGSADAEALKTAIEAVNIPPSSGGGGGTTEVTLAAPGADMMDSQLVIMDGAAPTQTYNTPGGVGASAFIVKNTSNSHAIVAVAGSFDSGNKAVIVLQNEAVQVSDDRDRDVTSVELRAVPIATINGLSAGVNDPTALAAAVSSGTVIAVVSTIRVENSFRQ